MQALLVYSASCFEYNVMLLLRFLVLLSAVYGSVHGVRPYHEAFLDHILMYLFKDVHGIHW